MYVQYINEHKSDIVSMVKECIEKVKNLREADGAILPFPEGPKMITNESEAPTVQTITTNKAGSQIPSSKYGELLGPNYQAVATHQVPWAISIHTKSFREAVTGTENQSQGHSDSETGYTPRSGKARFNTYQSDSDGDTFKSGHTSGRKSIREAELERENQLLIKKLQEKEEQYQQMIKQIHAGYEKQREEDRKQQEYVQQQIRHLQEAAKTKDMEHHEQVVEMAELRAMILELAKQKTGDEESEATGDEHIQGNTPKRPKKKRAVHTTPRRSNPTAMISRKEVDIQGELMPDEEPIALEEGLEQN
jgi:hypothetical protein